MKALLIAALLVSCATAPKVIPPPKAPDYAQAFASALCDRDSTYVSAHTTGRLAGTAYKIQAYFDTLGRCSVARFIPSDPAHLLFILTEEGVDVPYLFTFDEQLRCTDVR